MSTSTSAAPAALLEAPREIEARKHFEDTARCYDSGLRLSHAELCRLIDSIEHQGAELPASLAKRLIDSREQSRAEIIKFLKSVGRTAPREKEGQRAA